MGGGGRSLCPGGLCQGKQSLSGALGLGSLSVSLPREQTDASENITFPCGRLKNLHLQSNSGFDSCLKVASIQIWLSRKLNNIVPLEKAVLQCAQNLFHWTLTLIWPIKHHLCYRVKEWIVKWSALGKWFPVHSVTSSLQDKLHVALPWKTRLRRDNYFGQNFVNSSAHVDWFCKEHFKFLIVLYFDFVTIFTKY